MNEEEKFEYIVENTPVPDKANPELIAAVSETREIGEDLGTYDYYRDAVKRRDAGELEKWVSEFVPNSSHIGDAYTGTELEEGYHESQLRENSILKAAILAGDKALWFDFHEPKTIEGWDEWTKKHGPTDGFTERWGFKDE